MVPTNNLTKLRKNKLESNEQTREQSYRGTMLKSNKEETTEENYGELREEIGIKNSKKLYCISSIGHHDRLK